MKKRENGNEIGSGDEIEMKDEREEWEGRVTKTKNSTLFVAVGHK